MQQQWLRNAFGLVLAGLITAGCSSQGQQEEPPISDEPAPVPTAPQEPVQPVDEGPELDDDGVPVNPNNGNPLSRTFYFEFDRASISPTDLAVLEMHARFLSGNRNRGILLEGHCDERGTREYNLALGERRSDAVRTFLESSGVNSSQIETVSYGEEKPVDAGHSESAWSRNRRAELIYR